MASQASLLVCGMLPLWKKILVVFTEVEQTRICLSNVPNEEFGT